jgi:hypothetical protein
VRNIRLIRKQRRRDAKAIGGEEGTGL